MNIRFYRTVHSFDASFAAVVGAALDLLEEQLTGDASTYLIAETSEGSIGCIFLSKDAEGIGRIRLFYLNQAHRGKGIGAQMLHMVLDSARESGLQRVHVSTFDRHPEACRLYTSFEFKQVAVTSAEAFGQDMQQLDYELMLEDGEGHRGRRRQS
jgi:N-acetylglutamate synthase-like GNAT family acetyltransferase